MQVFHGQHRSFLSLDNIMSTTQIEKTEVYSVLEAME